MLGNKMFRIMAVLVVITVLGLILNTGCYQNDSDARVTIHLERYDLSSKEVQGDKRFIDRILEFFSTPAEAGAFWSNVKTNLTLTVENAIDGKLEFILPPNAASYSIVIPSGITTFTIISKWDSIYNGIQKNQGGELAISLQPGDQDITIQVKPMTYIVSVAAPLVGGPGLSIQWLISGMHSSVSSYKIYRSIDPNGAFTLLTSTTASSLIDTSIVVGVRYYYRVSTNGTLGESILSDIVSGIR